MRASLGNACSRRRYAFFVAMLMQAVLVPRLLPKLGYLNCMIVGCVGGIFHFALLGLATAVWQYVGADDARHFVV